MVPKQMRSAYSALPPMPDIKFKEISIDQLVQESYNSIRPDKKINLSPLTSQERYARQSGLQEVVSDDDENDLKNFTSFTPDFRKKHSADYDKFVDPSGADVEKPTDT